MPATSLDHDAPAASYPGTLCALAALRGQARVRRLPVLFFVLLSLVPAQARGQEMTRKDEEGERRLKYTAGMYEPAYGIYDEILERTEESPESLREALGLPNWLILGGQQLTRYESLDGRWRAGERGSDQQIALRTRLFMMIKDVLGPLRLQVELQDSRAELTDAGSLVTTSQVNTTDIQQLHLDAASTDFLRTGQPGILSLGRLTIDIARRRWVARNNFRTTTQAFDGAYLRLGRQERWHLESFLVEPVEIRMHRLDPVAPAHANTLWGFYAESRDLPWISAAAFEYFGHRSAGPHRDFDMLGVRLFKPNEAEGPWRYEIESAYQFGDVSAAGRFEHFQHAEVGYTFETAWSPQLLARFDYASRGFDSLYGARSFELTPTGIFGPFDRSNIISPGYRILIQPADRMGVLVQHRAWWLADAKGPWVGSGLQDPTGNSGRFLGQTVELRFRWGVLANAFLQVGYVHFAFGGFPQRVPGGPPQDHADYAYAQIELMF